MPLVSKAFSDIITFTRASSAWRVNASGLIASVASNAHRIDYDPVALTPKGLLLEEQRTNLLVYSEDLTNAAWIKVGASPPTVTSNAVAAPDGATTADLFARTAAASTSLLMNTTKSAVATTYALSCFVKKSVGDYFAVRMQGTFPNYAQASFNLATGAVATAASVSGTFANASASIEAFGNGWYRITLVATTDTATNVAAYLSVNSNNVAIDGTDSVTNSACYIWGAQLEAGAFSTSYIPTTSAAVTRAADVAVVTGTAFSGWFNSAEGTIVVRMDVRNATTAARVVAAVSDATAAEEFLIFVAADGIPHTYVNDGGVLQADLYQGAAIATETQVDIAFAYKANDFAMCRDGSAVATDTTGTLPTVNRLTLGARGTGGLPVCGHIKSIQYYPVRLPDAAIQVLAP